MEEPTECAPKISKAGKNEAAKSVFKIHYYMNNDIPEIKNTLKGFTSRLEEGEN